MSMHSDQRQANRGFTIVELLIVIVVIAILASISVVAYVGIQQRARDTQRLSDLRSIAQALELYKVDNGHYPKESDGASAGSARGRLGQGNPIDGMLAPYMDQIPVDPVNDATHYYYYDGKHNCGGQGAKSVLFARTMESGKTDSETCTAWGSEGGSDQAGAYHIVLGESGDA